MWARNLLFIALCLLGLTAVAAGLLQKRAIRTPSSFDPERYASESFGTVIDQVDAEWDEHWSSNDVVAAPLADDLTVARRLALALTGTVPSLEEIRAFEEVPPDERLEWYVSRLLEDRRYADYIGERLARSYVGTENGPFLVYRRRRFVTWLSEQLHEDVPYNELVSELIGDIGLWTDSPAVNFVTVTANENEQNQPDPIRLAGRTARAFLGIRIDCVQCHDDQLGNVQLGTEDEPREALQSDFHKLAAFFSEAESSLLGIKDRNQDPYRYKYLDAEDEEVIEPATPFQSELLPESGSRRERLASWVTHPENKAFARTAVNRIWALMFSRPLVEPVDDIPLYGEYPPGLELLAADFVDHGYNLKRLVRLIAGTSVFRLDSRAPNEVTERHADLWAVFPLVRLRPEQVAGAIIQSSSLRTIDANSHIISQLRRFFEQNEFIQRYGDAGEDEFDPRAGTIAQRLLLMNGELIQGRTKENLVNNASTRIAQLAPTDERAVETAYLAVLTRRPSSNEQSHFVQLLAESKQRNENLEDLYWVLINSTEFSWNH